MASAAARMLVGGYVDVLVWVRGGGQREREARPANPPSDVVDENVADSLGDLALM